MTPKPKTLYIYEVRVRRGCFGSFPIYASNREENRDKKLAELAGSAATPDYYTRHNREISIS